jgi:hypothetical protein
MAGVRAQSTPPIEFISCGSSCFEIASLPIIVDCDPPRSWASLVGRMVWGPLTNAGPIRVSVMAHPWSDNDYPLYVEVRPFYAFQGSCSIEPGSIIWATHGTASCDPDSGWVTSPWIHLPAWWLPLGDTYWFQLLGLATIGEPGGPTEARNSPAIRCVRVESQGSALLTATWSRTKALYR